MSGHGTPSLGALRERVDVASRLTTIGAGGGQTVTHTPRGKAWARVTTRSAGRIEAGDGVATRVTHSVVMRFRTDIGAGDRITYRGLNLEIIDTADLNGRRAYLACQCRAIKVTG
ncbi:MAG: phage head closure protein [Alphaproteobacteria bacterium]|nr:phage head closure protein [Alphaproteobacteria bacterium]